MRYASDSRPKIASCEEARRGEAVSCSAGDDAGVMRCNAMQQGSARRLEETCVCAGVWSSLIGSAPGGQREGQSCRGRIGEWAGGWRGEGRWQRDESVLCCKMNNVAGGRGAGNEGACGC
jgi:hypothetical protein